VFQFRTVKPALADDRHPDHRLAKLLAGNDMTHLPLLGREVLLDRVTADIGCAALEQAAGADAIAEATERVFGPGGRLSGKGLKLPPVPSLREVYAALLDSDEFRAACGRISASYAW